MPPSPLRVLLPALELLPGRELGVHQRLDAADGLLVRPVGVGLALLFGSWHGGGKDVQSAANQTPKALGILMNGFRK